MFGCGDIILKREKNLAVGKETLESTGKIPYKQPHALNKLKDGLSFDWKHNNGGHNDIKKIIRDEAEVFESRKAHSRVT